MASNVMTLCTCRRGAAEVRKQVSSSHLADLPKSVSGLNLSTAVPTTVSSFLVHAGYLPLSMLTPIVAYRLHNQHNLDMTRMWYYINSSVGTYLIAIHLERIAILVLNRSSDDNHCALAALNAVRAAMHKLVFGKPPSADVV